MTVYITKRTGSKVIIKEHVKAIRAQDNNHKYTISLQDGNITVDTDIYYIDVTDN